MRYQTVKIRKNSQISHGWRREEAATTKEDIVELLNAAYSQPEYDKSKGLWDAILERLNLPLCYQPAIAKVLLENRWRSAANPRAYVATASWTQGVKMQLPNRPLADIERADMSRIPKFAPTKRVHESASDEGRLENFIYHSFSETAEESPIPDWLQKKHESDAIDWQKVARYAVLKPEMKKSLVRALELRFEMGLSRDKAVATGGCADEKKEIEAAWKWIDRNVEERIAPLFRMDEPPSKLQKQKNASGNRSHYIPPGEAIRRVCLEERRRSAVPPWSLPSIMTEVGKYPENSIPVPPEVGVLCKFLSDPSTRWAKRAKRWGKIDCVRSY